VLTPRIKASSSDPRSSIASVRVDPISAIDIWSERRRATSRNPSSALSAGAFNSWVALSRSPARSACSQSAMPEVAGELRTVGASVRGTDNGAKNIT
jgi:hypothetical protein